MTTSRSYAFQETPLNTFIEEAYERVGIIGDNLTAQQMQAATRSLNFMLTEWMNDGLPLWTIQQKTLMLQTGQGAYPLASTVSEILEMNLRQISQGKVMDCITQDTVMTSISRSEWMALPNKNQQGQPTCFYWDRTIEPTLFVWPCPTSYYQSLFFTCTVMMEDAGDLLNQVQVPARFYEPLVAGLAAKLSVKYAPQKLAMMQELYQSVYAKAQDNDTQKQPLRIGVSWQGGYTW